MRLYTLSEILIALGLCKNKGEVMNIRCALIVNRDKYPVMIWDVYWCMSEIVKKQFA